MDLIQLKIHKDNSIIKYIKIIREFDNSLPMSDIRRKIEENDFVVGFDLEYYDVLEELSGTDRRAAFRNMINSLCESGAEVSIYRSGELSSLDLLDNWLGSLAEIERQTETDTARETGQ